MKQRDKYLYQEYLIYNNVQKTLNKQFPKKCYYFTAIKLGNK